MKDLRLSITTDGSHTVFSEKFKAFYHSKHGAIQESNHIFIEAGLKYFFKEQKQVSIMEMGFGTGLNMLLTFLFSETISTQIRYETVEAYPIDNEILENINYTNVLNRNDLSSLFKSFHSSKWNEEVYVNPEFTYFKHFNKIEESHFNQLFDLVFFDAFAPEDQEELWTPDIFKHISQFLKPNSILVSYCAKGSFKRALIAAGFKVEKVPGPPGKREIIRATYKGIE